MPRPPPKADAQPAAVLAADLLSISSAALARILGVSEASVSRLVSGNRQIDPESKEGELALLLVRVYRSLDALLGTDAAQRKAWMESHKLSTGTASVFEPAIGRGSRLLAVLRPRRGGRGLRLMAGCANSRRVS